MSNVIPINKNCKAAQDQIRAINEQIGKCGRDILPHEMAWRRDLYLRKHVVADQTANMLYENARTVLHPCILLR